MEKVGLMSDIFVTKRDNSLEKLDLDKINKSAERACVGLEDVSYSEIVLDAHMQFYDKIKTVEIDKALILCARTKIEKEPNYSYVAARLLLNNIYKEVFGCGVEQELFEEQYKQAFIENVHELVEAERLDGRMLDFDLEYLASKLCLERDNLFKYLGIQTLYDRYFIHIDGVKRETPQAFFMRVAMGLALNEKNKNERAVEFYDVLSQFLGMSSTPTLFNSGTTHAQLSSCFLSTVDDSLDGIMGCMHDQSKLSKYAGGLGVDFTPVRGNASYIKGTNGISSGVVPFLKIFNDVLNAWNQSGLRNGSGCAYLEPWHIDFVDFMETKKETGDEQRRCRSMNTAAWIPDLFMEKVKNDEEWYMFSPDEVSDLHDLYGKDFEKRYAHYVRKAKAGKIKNFTVTSAKELFKKIIVSLAETGHPWICFKDASNICYSNKNAGVVHSSNLCTEIIRHTTSSKYNKEGSKVEIGETAVCLAEGTKVLTDKGYVNIEKCDGLNVYTQYKNDTNFLEDKTFQKCKLINNGQKEVFKLTFSSGETIEATKNHKFLVRTLDKSKIRYKKNDYTIPDEYCWKSLQDLTNEDLIIKTDNLELIKEVVYDKEYLCAGWILGDGWQTDRSWGVCFGVGEEFARDTVMSQIEKWWNDNEFESGNGKFPKFEAKLDIENSTYDWASNNNQWKNFLINKFGFKTAIGPTKIISEKIIDSTLNQQANFLSGLFSADGCCTGKEVTLTSASKELLQSVQLILNNFGIVSAVTDSYIPSRNDRYQGAVRINGYENLVKFRKLIGFNLCPVKNTKLDNLIGNSINKKRRSRSLTLIDCVSVGTKNVYDLFVENKHHFIANGIVVHNCNLASFNYKAHLEYDRTKEKWKLNKQKLGKTVTTLIRMLDNVIDLNYYTIPEARKSNLAHRPIGLGQMGFVDVLHAYDIPYESQSAVELSSELAELVSYHAIKASCMLAKERGAFSTFEGSEWAEGNLPQDMFEKLFEERGKIKDVPSPKLSEAKWNALRALVVSVGVRNSSIMAIAPTATISYICGCRQSIEPDYSVLFSYGTLSGSFTMIDEWFVEKAKKEGIWGENLLNAIKQADGDISQLKLPESFKKQFKTAFKTDYKYLVDAAAARQQWIDMGQSFNIYNNSKSIKEKAEIYLYAYEKGLKTTYYLRGEGASKVEKSTVATQRLTETPRVCSIEAMKRGEVCESCQ